MSIRGLGKAVNKKLDGLRSKDETEKEMETELQVDEVYERPPEPEELEEEEEKPSRNAKNQEVPDISFDVTDPRAAQRAASRQKPPITAAEQRGKMDSKYEYREEDWE